MKQHTFLPLRIPVTQRVMLILFGLSLFFVLLEVGLRLGGCIVVSLQEHRNKLSIRQKGTYRILCLGESTTAGQWPPFLQEILNRRTVEIKFSVIDKGMVATNTIAILSQIDSYLNTYHPDMVVAMMGINDSGKHVPYERPTLSKSKLCIRSFRAYKLARLLWLHITIKAKEARWCLRRDKLPALNRQPIPLDNRSEKASPQQEGTITDEDSLKQALELNPKNAQACQELGWVYLSQGQLLRAEEYFKKALEFNPKNDWTYLGLGGVYRRQGQPPQAEEYFKKALECNPENDWAYMGLGWVYRDQDRLPQAEKCFKKVLELDYKNHSKNYKAYLGLGGGYLAQGQLAQAEEYLKKALELYPAGEAMARLCGALGSAYQEMGQGMLAEEYYGKANQIRLSEYDSTTLSNYRKLKEILNKRKIPLVCVQYPMRSIEPLRNMFQGDRDGIFFVDNEKTFKEAVKNSSYNEYFQDMFGGDFGHCTEKGNRLLAENIAKVIPKEVFHQ